MPSMMARMSEKGRWTRVGVENVKFDTGEPLVHHACHRVRASAADADNLNFGAVQSFFFLDDKLRRVHFKTLLSFEKNHRLPYGRGLVREKSPTPLKTPIQWRPNPRRSHECERGTHECVRYGPRLGNVLSSK